MTTYTSNGPIANNSNATFQAWVNEIYTGLVTQCGLTQTADTGQMAVPCVSAWPAVSTYAGYYVFAFNDTLQATAPIVFRLDFGSASTQTIPVLGITFGTASNGSGTITGTGSSVTAKLGCSTTLGPGASLYNSYFCYNATQGALWFSFKLGAAGATNLPQMNLFIFRTVNAAGAPTGDGAYFITVSNATGGGSYGCTTICNYNTSAVQAGPSSWFQIGGLASIPFALGSSSIVGTTGQVFPVWQYKGNASTPGWGITNAVALATIGDLPTGTTVSLNILGSLSMTYISTVMQPYAPYGAFGYANNAISTMWIWQ